MPKLSTLPSRTMFLLLPLLLPSLVVAASSAVATSAVVTTITSTYYSTTSSSTGTSSLVATDSASCSGSTNSNGQTSTCLAPAASAAIVTLYGSQVLTLTTKVVSTVGYTTEYSSVGDAISSSTSASSASSTTIESTSSSPISSTANAEQSASAGTSLASTGPLSSPSAAPSTDPSSTNNLGPKVAIAVAIVVGLIFISLFVGYLIKRHRDNQFKRSIGAPVPGTMERGGVKGFVAMNEMKDLKASSTTLSTIPESRPGTSTPRTEALAETFNDPPIIGSTTAISSPLPTSLAASKMQNGAIFEAPSRPSISADELPPRAASLHQRRASTDSAMTVRTTRTTRTTKTERIEADNNEDVDSCVNPFHEEQCTCRHSAVIQPSRDSVYEPFGQPGTESVGSATLGANGKQIHETSSTPKFELAAIPIIELEDTEIGMAH